MKRPLLWCLGLLVAGRALAAQAAADTAKPVALKFGWTPGMRSDVFLRVTNATQNGARADTSDGEIQLRLVVSAHQRGLLVELENVEAKRELPPGVPDAEALSAMLQIAAATMPTYVVDRNGAFLGLHDVNANLVAARRFLEIPKVDTALRRNPQARRLVDMMLSEAFFIQRAEEDWSAWVGAWTGSSMVKGKTYTQDAVEPIPVLSNVQIPFEYEYSLPDRRPCLEEQPLPECVELTLVSRPDPDSLRVVLLTFAERLGLAAGAVAFDSLRLENTVTVIADPATLRPYWADLRRLVSGAAREGTGPSQLIVQDRRRRYDFVYGARRRMTRFEPPGGVFRAAAGTWGWSRGGPACSSNSHAISFSARRDTIVIRHQNDHAHPDSASRYLIRQTTPSSIRGFLIGEDRRTAAGELVEWDLVFVGPDAYRWHRSDWEEGGYTAAIVRCPKG